MSRVARYLRRGLAPVLLFVGLVVPSVALGGALMDYLENQVVVHLFRSATWTKPSTLYVRLITTPCSDSASGTEVGAGVGYARAAVSVGDANWSAPSAGNGTTANVNIIAFSTPTGPWGQVVGFTINDAATAGNDLICAALTSPKTVNAGDDPPRFDPATLSIQIDN